MNKPYTSRPANPPSELFLVEFDGKELLWHDEPGKDRPEHYVRYVRADLIEELERNAETFAHQCFLLAGFAARIVNAHGTEDNRDFLTKMLRAPPLSMPAVATEALWDAMKESERDN